VAAPAKSSRPARAAHSQTRRRCNEAPFGFFSVQKRSIAATASWNCCWPSIPSSLVSRAATCSERAGLGALLLDLGLEAEDVARVECEDLVHDRAVVPAQAGCRYASRTEESADRAARGLPQAGLGHRGVAARLLLEQARQVLEVRLGPP
jgi:hypothetical protein